MDEDCDGCEGCLAEEVPVPSRRWQWLDLGIAALDFFSESAVALARAFATVNDCMRAHYNWQIDQREIAELHSLTTLSLTEE